MVSGWNLFEFKPSVHWAVSGPRSSSSSPPSEGGPLLYSAWGTPVAVAHGPRPTRLTAATCTS